MKHRWIALRMPIAVIARTRSDVWIIRAGQRCMIQTYDRSAFCLVGLRRDAVYTNQMIELLPSNQAY